MDEKYRKNYQNLADDYPFEGARHYFRNLLFPRKDNIPTMIRKEIRNFRRENERYDVRPDAEYFLILNFHQMIAAPLLMNRGLSNEDFHSRLTEAIAADVTEILRGATDEAHDREISGHSIVQSLSKRWDRLKTTEFKLWNKYGS